MKTHLLPSIAGLHVRSLPERLGKMGRHALSGLGRLPRLAVLQPAAHDQGAEQEAR